MRLRAQSRTDVGRRRKNNEDAYLQDDEHALFAVADGMGGHAAGEVASNAALDALRDHVLNNAELRAAFDAHPDDAGAEELRRMLETAVRVACYQVYSLTEMDPDQRGMGTTLSALLLTPAAAFVAHVGDSRIYMLRQGRAVMATRDHTYVAALVAQGKLTPEQAEKAGNKNVLLRAVGPKDYVEVDTRIVSHMPGDTFLLCTDGLHGYLKAGELEQL
ncbi:MAG TPA: protein phosphatase 2C domain-containing protein, partial [Myxococcota bacterium]|nr:protein phosphatase 2C domain-containing protein [Myxococcota bacterium]